MQLIGLARLGRDAEVRTVGDNSVANLSLAFDYFDPKAEKKRSTTWIDAALWGKQATALEQYLLKGTQVCCTVDDLHIETFQGRNGEGTKLVGKITAIKLAGGRQDGQQQAPAAAPAQRAPAPQPTRTAPPPRQELPADDDIPF
jgi:single-strand DNA-binding protein